MRFVLLLCSILPAANMALVQHQFWNRPKMNIFRSSVSHIKTLSMYFDDRERLGDFEGRLSKPIVEGLFSSKNDKNPWIISLSKEKRLAMEKFLGYTAKSASELTDEQVEEETLRWVVDTDIVSSTDGEDSHNSIANPRQDTDRQRISKIKYDGIKDLLVASSCHSKLESLAFLWNTIADTYEEGISSESSSFSETSNSVKLIVFPNSESLWDYDNIVTMLESIQIAQSLLPTEFDLRLDLFHPNYKHSPRMWYPQWHSPFPTIGLMIKAKKSQSSDNLDIERVRSKLDTLFQSGDAAERNTNRSSKDRDQILADSKFWLKMGYESEKTTKVNTHGTDFDEENIDWIVQSQASPLQLYRTLWNAALNLDMDQNRTFVVVDSFLDSYTLYRVAVTVNAALKRLDIPFRISQVYHPFMKLTTGNNNYTTRPPYGMIQLMAIKQNEHR